MALAALLASCGAPPGEPVDTRFEIAGSFSGNAVPRPITISLIAPDDTAFTAATRSEVVRYGSWWTLAVSTVLSDRAFSLRLPHGEDVPAELMHPASEAIVAPQADACDLEADAPAVQVSRIAVAGAPYPILALGPISNDADYLTGIAYYADDDSATWSGATDISVQSWAFATGAVRITGDCTYDDGMGPEVVQVVDVSLEEGWNPIVQTLRGSGGGLPHLLGDGVVTGGFWSAVLLD